MKALILILLSLGGLWFNYRNLHKSLLQIREKNKNEPSQFKRILNYPTTILWYGYLFAFFAGLSVNNLIF